MEIELDSSICTAACCMAIIDKAPLKCSEHEHEFGVRNAGF